MIVIETAITQLKRPVFTPAFPERLEKTELTIDIGSVIQRQAVEVLEEDSFDHMRRIESVK